MTKLTLEEMTAKKDQELHNSNMLNLVNARDWAKEYIEHLETEKKRAQDLVAEIETFAADEKNLGNTEEVVRFYRLSRLETSFEAKRY